MYLQREEGRSGEWEKPRHSLFVSELKAGLTFPSWFIPGRLCCAVSLAISQLWAAVYPIEGGTNFGKAPFYG